MNPPAANVEPIHEAIAHCLQRHAEAGAVCVAFSGGIDSMVLLDSVCGQRHASQISAIHVHHGLSPNADAWAEFCEAECAARGVELAVVRVAIDRANTDGEGIEGAARRARYLAFTRSQAPVVLAAQHADDQAETVLHQLLRGTGLAGLAAMGEARELRPGQTLVRPFLSVTRTQIEAFAKRQQLRWIEDESNTDQAFTRNYLRRTVLPELSTRFPHVRESLTRAARHAAEAAALNEALAVVDLAWDGTNAHANALDALDLTRQTNALYWWLRWSGMPPPSHAQLQEWARQLFRAPPSDKSHRAGGHAFHIVRKGGVLILVAAPAL